MCQVLFHALEIQQGTQTKTPALMELTFQWGEREKIYEVTEVHSYVKR